MRWYSGQPRERPGLIVVDLDRLAWRGARARSIIRWIDASLLICSGHGDDDDVVAVGRPSRVRRVARHSHPVDRFVVVPPESTFVETLAGPTGIDGLASRYRSAVLGPDAEGFRPLADALVERGVDVRLIERHGGRLVGPRSWARRPAPKADAGAGVRNARHLAGWSAGPAAR